MWRLRHALPACFLGLLVLIVAAGTLLTGLHADRMLRFGCVRRGVLYRSGQPGTVGLQRLVDRYGIRTIVNLRSQAKVQGDPLGQEEMTFARARRLRFFVLPLNDDPAKYVGEFLRIATDPANRPVLVHCAAGKERTGLAVAVYRIAVQGWSRERALREMQRNGLDPEENPKTWAFAKGYSPSGTPPVASEAEVPR